MATKFNPKDEFQLGKGADKPPYSPNVVNQTVQYGGTTWKGQPGGDWTEQSGGDSSSPGTYSTGDTSATGSQLGQANAFTTAYKGAIAAQPTYQELWKNIASGFNYPQLATTATNLQNQVAMIPQTQMGISRGFDVSSPQLQNMMNMQYWKLSPLAQRATAQAQTAAGLTGEQLAAAQAQQFKELQPYTTQAGLLQSILGNLTNILGAQIGQQYKMTPYGQLIATGAVPGTTGGTLGPYASQYYGQWTPFQ